MEEKNEKITEINKNDGSIIAITHYHSESRVDQSIAMVKFLLIVLLGIFWYFWHFWKERFFLENCKL